MIDAISAVSDAEVIRRAAVLPDEYVLTKDDAPIVALILGNQHFSYSQSAKGKKRGSLTWGAFGAAFRTLGELRAIAAEHQPEGPDVTGAETVGLDLFGNMLDTIAFLRVRIRALGDVLIDKGVIDGPDLLGKYNEYHERSFEAYRDLMLLRPDVFEQRFGQWLKTEREYRHRLEKSATGR